MGEGEVTWLAIILCALAIILFFGLIVVHIIDLRNSDKWADGKPCGCQSESEHERR